jgi:uncharacterized phage infection (PIP) family protein YhgE
MDVDGPAASYVEVQQKALAAYNDALRDAMAPLEDRYKQTLGNLIETQRSYYQELGQRLTAVYRSYGETVAAISAGSPKLDSAVQAYSVLLGKYGEYADPARWMAMLAPAQKTLGDAVAEAQLVSDAPRLQNAVEAYYGELNRMQESDGAVGALSDAHSHYAKQLQELQREVDQGLQQALEAVNEGIKSALTDTGHAFDLDAALKSFAEELKSIGDETVNAYRQAADAAARCWEDNWSAGPSTADAADGAANAQAARSLSPLVPTPAATPAPSPTVAKAMAANPASMPRASWVNIPEPEDEENHDQEEKGHPRSNDAPESDHGSAEAPGPGSSARRRTGPTTRGKGGGAENKDENT